MSVYLVALVEPDDDVWSRIEAEWPENHYRLAETLAMVSIPSKGKGCRRRVPSPSG